jgi:four helix bundle protein
VSRDHRKLRAFELADELVLEIYRATRSFPMDERFGLVSQMRRAAVSVAANIVEGCARRTESEYINFLSVSFASLRELGYFLDLSERLAYLLAADAERLKSLQSEAATVLAALLRSLQKPP